MLECGNRPWSDNRCTVFENQVIKDVAVELSELYIPQQYIFFVAYRALKDRAMKKVMDIKILT